MGVWLDILDLAASGESEAAREMLAIRLPFALREFVPAAGGSRRYKGHLPQAVARFIYSLPERERALAKSFENDFVDYILDDVIASVERSLWLVDLCRRLPEAKLDELVRNFPWDRNLKRDATWKGKWVADMLRSMLEADIPLPDAVANMLGEAGEPRYGFNEIAYTVAPRRLELSWQDFKRDQELDHRFLCIADSDESAGIADEGLDYGSITMAQIVLGSTTAHDADMILDLHLLGAELSLELADLMEQLHAAKPKDGYHPIAWHNVFWNICSEYEGLRLELQMLAPFCDRDQELADLISGNYADVVSTSRPVIVRRRQKLYGACDERVLARLRERFTGSPEQTAPRITHVVEEVGS